MRSRPRDGDAAGEVEGAELAAEDRVGRHAPGGRSRARHRARSRRRRRRARNPGRGPARRTPAGGCARSAARPRRRIGRARPTRPSRSAGSTRDGRPAGKRKACGQQVGPVRPSRSRLATITSWAGGPKRYAQDASTKRPIIASTSRSCAPCGLELERLLAVPDALLEVAVERDPQPGAERLGPVVGDVDDDAAEALVGGPDGDRRERPAQVVVGDLGLAAMVDHAPAGARHEVAEPQDEPAAARRGGAPPLAEDLGHHLAGDRARQLEVAVVVDAAGARRGRPRRAAPGSDRARRRSPSRCPTSRGTPAFQRGWWTTTPVVAPGSIDSIASSSGTLAKARHSEANRTPATRASVSGRR